MSEDTKRVEESALASDSVLDLVEDWYHVPVLAGLLGFMLWVRMLSYGKFVRDGRVYFSGNDPWYHFRETMYVVENWPSVMPFDPWTGFPTGTSVGQFGTLFDQLIATAALIVGLGDPSAQTVAKTVLVAPAVFGTLVAIPTYYVGKRLGDSRFAGLVGAAVLALLPGLFLQRGLVGTADHNIAEPLFQATAVLAMMVAVSVAERERPVYEQVAGREWRSLRGPLMWSALAGVATALYLWVWPPGVVLVGIFGVFFVVKLAANFVRRVSPDHLAFVAAASMTVTALLSLIPLGEASFRPVTPSLIQPVLALGVGVGAVFMAWLARKWEAEDVAESLYPVAVGGMIAVAAAAVWLVLPSLWDQLANNMSRLFLFFDQSATTGTVAEAQPFLSRAERLGVDWYWVVYLEYGLAFFTAFLAALVMLVRAAVSGEHRGERLLVLVWAAMVTSMAFTQVRFNYYLAVPVAVLNAYLVAEVVRFVGVERTRSAVENVEWHQVFAVVAVLLVVLMPLAATDTVGGSREVRFGTAVEVGDNAGPGAVTRWADSLHWLRDNTPEPGTFGGANNEMAYYGTYDQAADFEYPSGAYGVMSWWDYGHWITVEGHRVPVANPFQQHATEAANYLLAPNESAANEVRLEMSEDDAETRYVMVDWQMVAPGSKFAAPVIFYKKNENLSVRDMYDPVFQQTQRGGYQRVLYLKKQRYYESQMVRLYRYHGSAMQPQPIVVDWDPLGRQGQYKQVPQGQNASFIRTFDSMEAAREFVEQDGSAQIGGRGPYPSEYVPALKHYRLVQVSDSPAPGRLTRSRRFVSTPTWVKTFERVPGATVEGEGPPNSTVTAGVELRIPSTNTTFVYNQRAETGPDGSFEMTLPYSTTGYGNWGPEQGYTNVSVRATGAYTFSTPIETTDNGTQVLHSASVNVSEAKVIGEDDEPVTVEMERVEFGQQGNNSTAPGANNSTSGDGNESSALAPTALPQDQSSSVASPTSAGGDGTLALAGPVAPVARE
jgi:dolichyl-diphosphooligosaccharide--protein glycosyltransferase